MITVRDLSVDLGGRRILDRLDFDVESGEAVALVGPNGAGKTTVLRSLMGLVRYGGRITVDGHDARLEPITARRLLGYMPQVPAFCEETARASLEFVARLRGFARGEVTQRIEQVGLAAHAGRSVRTFSSGMRQRLSLAAALLGDPPALVLDEPTASLDLKGQAELIDLLRDLKEDGRTLLLSSHRTEEIRALAQRVVVLDEGRAAAPDLAAAVADGLFGFQSGDRSGAEAAAPLRRSATVIPFRRGAGGGVS